MYQNKIKWISIAAFLFSLVNAQSQQLTGAFPAMDGGFEGQAVGALPNVSSSSRPTNTWAKSNATGKGTVRQISGNGGRTGDKYLSMNDTASNSANALSPALSNAAITGGASYVIQFFYRASDLLTLPNTAISVGLSNASGTAANFTTWNPNTATNNAVWLKSVNVVTAANAATAGTGFSVFRIAGYGTAGGTSNGKAIDIDDWVVYAGIAADTILPQAPGVASIANPTSSTLDLSWLPSSDVDSGGYIVVRYSADPTGQPDLNPNGVYSLGNTVGTGVVVYSGTNTFFKDNQLANNTTYWYRVYTVDKAFNYSNTYSLVSGATNSTSVKIVYYVDATNGNDSNTGLTPGQAWKTISKVNSVTFIPGDSILFKCGELWQGTPLVLKGSGTKGKPIVVSKYGVGTLPRIDADANGIHNDYAVFLQNQQYVTISNLEITNNYAATQTDNKLTKGVYVLARNAGVIRNIQLRDLYIHHVTGANDSSSASGAIYSEVLGTTTVTRFDSLIIENNRISNCDRTGISNNSTWDGRDITGDWGSTPWRPTTNYIIRGNYLDSIGGNGIIIRDAQSPLCEFNTLYKCGLKYTGNAIFTFGCDDALVQYNEISYTVYNANDVDASALDGDYRCKRSVFQYNYTHDNDGGFAVVVCNPGGTPGRFNDSTVFRYNVSQNDAHFNVGLSNEGHTITVTGQATNSFIYNNSIYTSTDPNYIIIHKRWGNSGTVYPDKTFYYNNIFYVNKKNPLYSFQSSTNNVLNYNVYYHPLGGVGPIDANALTSDPQYINPGSATAYSNSAVYQLKPTSPCINSGFAVPGAPNKDFLGNKVPVGIVDRGAFEYQFTFGVKLGMFKGFANKYTNDLSWTTYSEVNNECFMLQRSTDGNRFEDYVLIPTKSLNGNSTEPINYQFIDKQPYQNMTYYRLKQIDKDGKSSFSNVIAIKTMYEKPLIVVNNPVKNNLLQVKLPLSLGQVSISITSLDGKSILQKEFTSNYQSSQTINIPNYLAKGMYVIQVKGKEYMASEQFIIE